jgi:hypothetical protein
VAEDEPVAADKDALDRLVSDLNLLFVAAPATPGDVPAATAPTLDQLAAEVDSRFQDASAVVEREDVEPLPSPVEPHADPNSAEDEWGLFDPKQCGLDAVLMKLKPQA